MLAVAGNLTIIAFEVTLVIRNTSTFQWSAAHLHTLQPMCCCKTAQ
jgi:hypothetical protein